MKKTVIRLTALMLALVTMLGATIGPAFAATYTTDYNRYTAPSSSDYAYWNGSRVVKAPGTTVSEMKWMQAALNWCIANLGMPGNYLDVDGSMGPASRKVVLEFQKAAGLTQDGSFGPKCISTMKDVLSGKRSLTWMDAPETVKIAAGSSTTVKIRFGGVPISRVSGYYIGKGISPALGKVTWGDNCSTELIISTDSSFSEKASVTLQLINDKTGVLMSKTITIEPKAKSGGKYQPDKALKYAATYWNKDKDVLCAEFVSRCLRSGGLDVYSASCTYLLSALEKKGYGTLMKLTVSKNGYISMDKNSGKISAGDLIFCYCSSHERPYTHVYICSGVDANGYITGYTHHKPLNGTIRAKTCGYCYDTYDAVYVYHIEV